MSSPSGQTNSQSRLHSLSKRAMGSAVLWSWGMNAMRLGFGLLVLPLLLKLLTQAEYGFYDIVLQLVAVVPLLDMGLAWAIERNLSFAMSGAKKLQAHGVHGEVPSGDGPNEALLWRIVHTAKVYYAGLAVVGVVGLGSVGTWIVALNVSEVPQPGLAWWTLAIAVANAGLEIYAGWWNVVLRGINGITASARIMVVAHTVKLLLSCALLVAGAGMISVFAAGVVSSYIVRRYSRRAALALLPPPPSTPATRAEVMELLRVFWPTSWRVGLQLLSAALTVLLLKVIYQRTHTLAGVQPYGLSLTIMGIIQGMAAVWVQVKWPFVAQLRARHDHQSVRKVLRPRMWLQGATYLAGAAAAASIAPLLIHWLSPDKELLPLPWLVLLLRHGFLDLQTTFWTSLLATENRVPSLWPMVATNAANVILTLVLIQTTSLGLGVFILVPILVNLAFNYWYWPLAGARNLRTTWLRFAFARGA